MREIDPYKYFLCTVYNTLRVGHIHAQTRRELCAKLGCNDRTLRKAIERLRKEYPILSRDDGKGYYLPEKTDEGREETKQWLKRQNGRIRSIQKSQTGAMRFAGPRRRQTDVKGQLKMFGAGSAL